VLRPWLRGLCPYHLLLDGTIRLLDLGRMNEAIDVMDENERRLRDKG
jgi:hypothetical protein